MDSFSTGLSPGFVGNLAFVHRKFFLVRQRLGRFMHDPWAGPVARGPGIAVDSFSTELSPGFVGKP